MAHPAKDSILHSFYQLFLYGGLQELSDDNIPQFHVLGPAKKWKILDIPAKGKIYFCKCLSSIERWGEFLIIFYFWRSHLLTHIFLSKLLIKPSKNLKLKSSQDGRQLLGANHATFLKFLRIRFFHQYWFLMNN